MVFHYKVPDTDSLEVFEQDDDFLIRFDNFFSDIGQRPKQGKSIGIIPYQLPKFGADELKTLLTQMKTKAGFEMRDKEVIEAPVISEAKPSVFERLGRFFGLLNYSKP